MPVGSFVGQYTGWRGPFWALAVLASLAAVLVGRFIPETQASPRPSSKPSPAPSSSTMPNAPTC
ncbi:hypothetical protein ACF09I_31245 [Streptomyces sp. NPDC014940]|uniref:hypothetical protein n=1 Tax=Streptomyces sp. NPDC014940 TaxID=3364932 RepID=UPI0036FDFC03